MNQRIFAKSVRLIDEKGVQVGIVEKKDALTRAIEAGLDLVEVSPDSSPPVCRILSYGKYKYKQSKKTHKKHHVVQLKEIRVRPKIGKHDLETKIKQARKFIERKDRVLINMLFKGREMAHKEIAKYVFEEFTKVLEDIAKVEPQSKSTGRSVGIILTPK
ncbi:MAG: translation initiation factor IF-3 [Candidatus Scalinduaceae bacterium]